VRDLGSLIAEGRRLDVDRAVTLVIGCCKTLARDQPMSIDPTRFGVSDAGAVTLLPWAPTARALGYAAPELRPTRGDGHFVGHEPASRGLEHSGYATPIVRTEADVAAAAVFALGCMLWELLAARLLFVGKTDYEMMTLSLDAVVPPIDDVPAELEAIVRKALAKAPGARYASPALLADSLSQFLADSALN
jgi:serine/threonine protein kinase